MLVNHPLAVGSAQYQDAYTQMLATYAQVEAAYARRGCEMPTMRLQDPQAMCLILQRMWHDIQFDSSIHLEKN